jgi:hypothetical protein
MDRIQDKYKILIQKEEGENKKTMEIKQDLDLNAF